MFNMCQRNVLWWRYGDIVYVMSDVDQWIQLCIGYRMDVIQQLQGTNAPNKLLFWIFDQNCNQCDGVGYGNK